MLAASAHIYFSIAIDCKNKVNMKVAASNTDVKKQLFSNQQILCVRVTTVQQKNPEDLTF